MPIQGQLQGKKPLEQQTRKEDETPEIVRKNSAILENLHLMYETIHKETEILKELKKTQEEPTKQDISAGVMTQEKKKTNNKSMIPLFKKKPHLPAPALLPRWK
jgi:hypothetical protein